MTAKEKPEQCPNCGVRHRTITFDQCVDRSMSEKTLQERVTGRARRRNFKVAHAGKLWLPGKNGSEGMWLTPMSKGWPDLTLAKEGHSLIFIELKTEEGTVDDDQWFWLRLLASTGNKCAVIRPSDLRTGVVKTILNEGAPIGR